jgi:hypothetical protein
VLLIDSYNGHHIIRLSNTAGRWKLWLAQQRMWVHVHCSDATQELRVSDHMHGSRPSA